MFADSASQDDHARLLRLPRQLVEVADVLDDVDNEAGIAERVEVDHISQRAVSQCWAKNGYIVLIRSVVKRKISS